MVSFVGGSGEVSLLMEVGEEVVEEHGALGLKEGVVALVELVLDGLLVAVGSDGEHLSPQAVVLAVGEPEDVVGTYFMGVGLVGLFKIGDYIVGSVSLPVIP